MDIVQSKMKKWLNGFAIFFSICSVLVGISLGGTALACLIFIFNKKIFDYKLDDTTTIKELFSELNITSRWNLVTNLAAMVVSLAIVLTLLILIKKWFKSTSISGEPFSTESVKYIHKIAKLAIIASIAGLIFETILSMFVYNIMSSSYETILFVGLLMKCLAYIFAYAHATRKEDLLATNEKENIQDENLEK